MRIKLKGETNVSVVRSASYFKKIIINYSIFIYFFAFICLVYYIYENSFVFFSRPQS